jgi:hypothetical protein
LSLNPPKVGQVPESRTEHRSRCSCSARRAFAFPNRCYPLASGAARYPLALCRTRRDAITVAAARLDGNKLRWERVLLIDGIAVRAGDFVSITLDDFDVDPQTKPVLRAALERTPVSLGLTDDLADGIIAKRIIELAKAGDRNPDLLCEAALEKYAVDCGETKHASCRRPASGALQMTSALACISAPQGRTIVITAAAARGLGNSPKL